MEAVQAEVIYALSHLNSVLPLYLSCWKERNAYQNAYHRAYHRLQLRMRASQQASWCGKSKSSNSNNSNTRNNINNTNNTNNTNKNNRNRKSSIGQGERYLYIPVIPNP